MKNVREAQGKSSGAGKELLKVLILAAICIVGTFFVTKTFLGHSQPQEASNEKTVSVAVTTSEVSRGGFADGCYSFVNRPEKDVPPDAILNAGDLAGKVSTIKLMPNTILTSDMFVKVDMDEIIDDTSRQVPVNYVTVDTKIQEGSYIDIRLKTYSTKDDLVYADDVVLAKKKVLALDGNTIYLNLNEKEQLQLGVASVDVSRKTTAKNGEEAVLYATSYANASQAKAVETYKNPELASLIESNSQLINQAQKDLAASVAPKTETQSNVAVVPDGQE